MELEEEMQRLVKEEAYLADVIKQLDGLTDYKDLVEELPDIKQLIQKLKLRKKTIKARIADITEDLISIAEAYSVEY